MTPPPTPTFWQTKSSWVMLGFLAIAGYFLATEHAAHVVPFLPWLLLLACPIMHLFMHRGHGGHGEQGSGDAASENKDTSARDIRS